MTETETMRYWQAFTALAMLLIAPCIYGQTPVTVPGIPGVVAAGSPFTLIKAGMKSSEGTISGPDGTLYFTEPSENRIYHVDAKDNVTVLFDAGKVDDPAGERWRVTALAMDRQGRIFATRRANTSVGIAIVYPPAQAKFVTEAYEGKPFSAPNDLTMAKNGGIYFTEPGAPQTRDHSVYYIKPSGETILATGNLRRPNGIVLSHDEKLLYVADSDDENLFVFDVMPDGTVQNRRAFAHLAGIVRTEKGMNNGVDGLAIDTKDRVYCISNAGIEVFSREGKALGIIPVPVKAQNLAFAGKDRKTLYIVGRGSLYRLHTLAQGYKDRSK
jgi:gluconolactonase